MIGVGIDTVDVARFRTLLDRRRGFAARVFTEQERAACAGDARRLAARFAAKEAVMKALGVGLGAFGFHDAEVVRAGSGAPSLVLAGRALDLSAAAGVVAWHLSLTHTDLVASAVAVAS